MPWLAASVLKNREIASWSSRIAADLFPRVPLPRFKPLR
jgi:hypothetical protein